MCNRCEQNNYECDNSYRGNCQNTCAPKCDPCRKQDKLLYCGKDIECLDVKSGHDLMDVMELYGETICQIQQDMDNSLNRTHVEVIEVPEGVDCENGGVEIRVIEDITGNLISTNNICNGINGTDGVNGVDGINGTDGINGINANSNYGNTLFVDEIYGNDLTGTRERFDLPYRNIQTAITAAHAKDTVWIRSGEYVGNIVLKNLVNLHFEKVTVIGQMKDDGIAVKSTITGSLSLKYTGNNTIELTGSGTHLTVDMEEIDSERTAIYMNPIVEVGESPTMSLNIKRIVNIGVNYAINLGGMSNLNINASEQISTRVTTMGLGGAVIVRINPNFGGLLDVYCPLVMVGGSSEDGLGLFYSDEVSTKDIEAGQVKIEVGLLGTTYPVSGSQKSPTDFGFINRVGGSTVSFNINKVYEMDRDFIHIKGASVGSTFFSGSINTTVSAVRYASTSPFVLKDTRIHSRNSIMPAIIVGNPTTEDILPEGIEGVYDMSVEDSVVIRDFYAPDGSASAIILKSGESPIFIKNTEIFGTGGFSGDSISTDGGIEQDMYLKNVTSNHALGLVTNVANDTFDYNILLKVPTVPLV